MCKCTFQFEDFFFSMGKVWDWGLLGSSSPYPFLSPTEKMVGSYNILCEA